VGTKFVAVIATLVLLVVKPVQAHAFEVNVGVSVGGILAGVVPRLALSPHVGLSLPLESGFLLEVHELCSVLPIGGKLGIGVFNQTSAAIGYASKTSAFSIGPSLSIYAMPACGAELCGRVVGLSPGGHAQASLYFAGPVGVSIHADAAWVGGTSLVLPGGLAVMVVAGPVIRWRSE
jgi:hypothetical protein